MTDPIQTERIVEATRDAIGRVLRKHGPWDRLADASAWHVLNEAAQAALSTAYPMIKAELYRRVEALDQGRPDDCRTVIDEAFHDGRMEMIEEALAAIRTTELPLAEKERE